MQSAAQNIFSNNIVFKHQKLLTYRHSVFIIYIIVLIASNKILSLLHYYRSFYESIFTNTDGFYIC